MSKTLEVKPRVSEKAYASSQKGVYVFMVPNTTNKVEVSKAVEAQFNVSVVSVNIANQKGKAVRFYRNGKFDNGSRSDFKKAYVRLSEGQTIPVFAADEKDDAKKAAASAQTAKASKKVKKD